MHLKQGRDAWWLGHGSATKSCIWNRVGLGGIWGRGGGGTKLRNYETMKVWNYESRKLVHYETTKLRRSAQAGKYETWAMGTGCGVTKVRKLKRNVESRKYETWKRKVRNLKRKYESMKLERQNTWNYETSAALGNSSLQVHIINRARWRSP